MLLTKGLVFVASIFLISEVSARVQTKKRAIGFIQDPDTANSFWPTKEQTVAFFESMDMELVESLNIKPGFNRQEFIHRLATTNISGKEIREIYTPLTQEQMKPLRIKARALAKK